MVEINEAYLVQVWLYPQGAVFLDYYSILALRKEKGHSKEFQREELMGFCTFIYNYFFHLPLLHCVKERKLNHKSPFTDQKILRGKGRGGWQSEREVSVQRQLFWATEKAKAGVEGLLVYASCPFRAPGQHMS